MTELDNILYGQYIIDGVQMPLSPARMLRECTLEPPLEPDGAPETVADEHLEVTNFGRRRWSVTPQQWQS